MKDYSRLPINVRSNYEEDFDQGFLTTQVAVSAGGSGNLFASTSALSANKNAIGLGVFQTGTTATSSVRIFTTSSNIEIGGGSVMFCVRVGLTSLFDATQDGLFRIGLGNVITATTTDQDHAQGIYFEYDRSVVANWRLCTASASVRTKNDSLSTVAIGYKNLCFIVNSAGTSVQFYVNGIAVGSAIATNLPLGLAVGVNGYIKKKAGTTNKSVLLDYIKMQKIVNVSR